MGSTHLILYDISQLLTISTPTMDNHQERFLRWWKKTTWSCLFFSGHPFNAKLKKPFSWVIYLMRLSQADKWESATKEFDEIIKCKDKMLNCPPPPQPENSSSLLVKSLPTEHRYYIMLSCYFFVYPEEVPAAHRVNFLWVNSIKHLQMDLWKPRNAKHNKDKKNVSLLFSSSTKSCSQKYFAC